MATADVTTVEASSPIPIPPDFPVTWERPEDERLLWRADRMHFPEPVTPLMAIFTRAFNGGSERAADAYELPIRVEHRRLNTYLFVLTVPRVPPQEMEAQGEKAGQRLKAGIAEFAQRWNSEWLPEVKEHLAFWEGFDLGGASMPELLAHLDDTEARFTRLLEIHFLIAYPFLVAPSMFDELYEDLFGKEGAFDALKLLQGFGNKTVEGGHALWELSRQALASPVVGRVLKEHEAADVTAALEESTEGQAFLAELDTYLNEYGQRSDVFFEVGYPHWVEDPTTPVRNLKEFIAQPDRELSTELTALADERERLIAAARERLKGYPRPVVDQFEFLLQAAQAATIMQEDHNYWIDQRGTYKVRQVLLELGRRIAQAGAIQDHDDVFYLNLEEVRETAGGLPHGDRRPLVAQRKAEMDRFRAVQQPPALGTPPPGAPHDDPLGRAIGKFFGTPPPESADPGVLRGGAGSPGVVRGKAKVVHTLSEAGKVQPGDILVAPSTMPAWTPLFATAAAVVTDAGGILSHCAIVAREYGIPAVVGTGRATAVIEDGQMLEVDGDTGTVSIVDVAS